MAPELSVRLVGFDRAYAASVEEHLPATADGSDGVGLAHSARAGASAIVLCLGPEVELVETRSLVEAHGGGRGERRFCIVVLPEGSDPADLGDLVAKDLVHYLSRSPLAPRALAAVIRGCAGFDDSTGAGRGPDFEELSRIWSAVEAGQLFSLQRTLADLGELVARTCQELLGADRAYCFFHEAKRDVLWTGRDADLDEAPSAAVGIASFVMRSGSPVLAPVAKSDPRYDAHADDPQGDGSESLVAVPIPPGASRALAVVLCVRAAGRPGYTDEDLRQLSAVASLASSRAILLTTERKALEAENESELATMERGRRLFRAALFGVRREAYAHRPERLRLPPRLNRAGLALLLALAALPLGIGAALSIDTTVDAIGIVIAETESSTSKTPSAPEYAVILFVPGGSRSLVSRGQEIDFRPEHPTGVSFTLSVRTVGDDVLEPGEALRKMPTNTRGLLTGLDRPVVLVEASLPMMDTVSGETLLTYHEGIVGTAQIPSSTFPFLSWVGRKLRADGTEALSPRG